MWIAISRRDSYLRHIRNHHPQPAQQQNNLEHVCQSGQQEHNRCEDSKLQVGAGVPPSNELQKNNEEKDTPIDHTEKENDIQNQEDDCITSEKL